MIENIINYIKRLKNKNDFYKAKNFEEFLSNVVFIGNLIK